MTTINKTIFICSKCDAQYPKWSGRCLECGAWGTLKETNNQIANSNNQKTTVAFDNTKLVDFKNVSSENFTRIKTNLTEIDEIFGGGIVKGSLILLGGEPGIGKSTLVLQILKALPSQDPLLYVSGEESAAQIKLRIERLKYQPDNLKFLSETNIEQVCAAIQETKPSLAIIDSIQTVYSSSVESEPGNVAQIRACTAKLMEVAKKSDIPIIIIGHVTKDGAVAGPKTLEHLVDVVLYLEGDGLHGFRILRSSKNRFGSTNEVGILEMTSEGLVEVKNPTQAFLQVNNNQTSGSAISCIMEGSRPFLVEVQALVTPTVFGYPQRKTSGYDMNRLQMLSAVLFKRAGLNLNTQDIHLNIVGGLKVTEPAIDLAVCAAIISALKNIPIAKDTLILGEVGLGGEIRNVPNLERRLLEIEKLGFQRALVPSANLTKKYSTIIQPIKILTDLLKNL